MKEILGDALFVAGLAAIGLALWWMYPPLALLLGGACFAVFGIVVGSKARTS